MYHNMSPMGGNMARTGPHGKGPQSKGTHTMMAGQHGKGWPTWQGPAQAMRALKRIFLSFKNNNQKYTLI
jgi:hypothetical protein